MLFRSELRGRVDRLLDDSAADDATLKAELKEKLGIELLASPNPRGRKPITADLPRGLDRVTSRGVPVCRAGFPFDFLGCRHEEERFLFRAPDLPSDGKPPNRVRHEKCSGTVNAPAPDSWAPLAARPKATRIQRRIRTRIGGPFRLGVRRRVTHVPRPKR